MPAEANIDKEIQLILDGSTPKVDSEKLLNVGAQKFMCEGRTLDYARFKFIASSIKRRDKHVCEFISDDHYIQYLESLGEKALTHIMSQGGLMKNVLDMLLASRPVLMKEMLRRVRGKLGIKQFKSYVELCARVGVEQQISLAASREEGVLVLKKLRAAQSAIINAKAEAIATKARLEKIKAEKKAMLNKLDTALTDNSTEQIGSLLRSSFEVNKQNNTMDSKQGEFSWFMERLLEKRNKLIINGIPEEYYIAYVKLKGEDALRRMIKGCVHVDIINKLFAKHLRLFHDALNGITGELLSDVYSNYASLCDQYHVTKKVVERNRFGKKKDR